MANRTATGTHLSRLAQSTRIHDGNLNPSGPSLTVGDYTLLVGDEVVTRHNQRRLRTDRGVMVKNRDHFTITTIHNDSSVTVFGRTGTVRLPANSSPSMWSWGVPRPATPPKAAPSTPPSSTSTPPPTPAASTPP